MLLELMLGITLKLLVLVLLVLRQELIRELRLIIKE
nr:hypothetical protein Q903MT_gene4648 [Picea sitchensis]